MPERDRALRRHESRLSKSYCSAKRRVPARLDENVEGSPGVAVRSWAGISVE